MTKRAVTLAGFLALAPLLAGAQDAAPPVELKEGDTAPPFSLPGSDGKTHSNADYKGRTIVLAWFPKAFTGG
jgi:peroxiredoxin